jgi:8-oxo-dGTP pyrophosphatase MutT (NUDIX family)
MGFRFRKGVFIVVYRLDRGVPKYLLLKRKLHWSGWEFPKGGVERFETKKSAVRRELGEEVGLDPVGIKHHKYSGKYLYPKLLKDRPGIKGQTFSLYSVEVGMGRVHIDKREEADSRWLNYKRALGMLAYGDQKESLKIVNEWLLKRNS